MLELFPGTGVYWYPANKACIQKAAKMLHSCVASAWMCSLAGMYFVYQTSREAVCGSTNNLIKGLPVLSHVSANVFGIEITIYTCSVHLS